MTERDKLIELMQKQFSELYKDGDWNFNEMIIGVADKILADGWTKPMCKPGDTVYVINKNIDDKYVVSEGVVLAIEYALCVDTTVKVKFTNDYGCIPMWYSLSKVFTDRKMAEKVAQWA